MDLNVAVSNLDSLPHINPSNLLAQLEQMGIVDYPPKHPIPPSSPANSNPRKRQRLESSNYSDRQADATRHPSSSYMASDATLQRDVVDSTSHTAAGLQGVDLETLVNTSFPTFNVDARYEYAYPSAGNIPSVFRKKFSDIIVRRGYEASILISFPPSPAHCQLVLDVEASAVVRLAMKSYGAEICEEARQRSLVLPSGASAAIRGSVKLRATEVGAWDEFLGDLVGRGVRHSPEHIDEVLRGIVLSECLAMEIPGAADLPARISLTMDPFTLEEISTKLWPS